MKETNYLIFIKNLFINYKTIFRLSYLDSKLKYRRTLLGPIWNSLAQFITILLLSIIWSKIFKIDLKDYLPRLYVGMTCFALATYYTSSATSIVYGQYASYFKNLNTNISLIYGRFFFTSIINYAHCLPIYIIIFFTFGITIGFSSIFFLLGLVLVFLNGIWISFIISALCSRFRDLSPLTESVMAAAGLITPILWDKKLLGEYANLVYLNPFTSFVESMRDPLLGYDINYNVYLYLIIFLVFGNIVTYFFYNKKRKILPYWI
jgi:ABC-type polysaccharide/polyol phosphate export permease